VDTRVVRPKKEEKNGKKEGRKKKRESAVRINHLEIVSGYLKLTFLPFFFQ